MASYSEHSVAALRTEANARNLLADGRTGEGGGAWRATASKAALCAALEANDKGTPLHVPGVTPNAPADALAALDTLRAALSMAHLTADDVRRIVREETRPAVHVCPAPDAPPVDCGRQHERFPDLLDALAEGIPVMLVGPAGSGKSSAVRAAYTALGLSTEADSVCALTPESKLLGYRDMHGTAVETALLRAYRDGAGYLCDETDNGNPNVLAVLNLSLDNGHASFCGVQVARHEHFRFTATANTFGRGDGRTLYVGRNVLDAAFLDRFLPIHWDYDAAFERECALVWNPEAGAWVERVQAARQRLADENVPHIVSPRASIIGARMLKRGWSEEKLAESLLFRGCDDAVRTVIAGESAS